MIEDLNRDVSSPEIVHTKRLKQAVFVFLQNI